MPTPGGKIAYRVPAGVPRQDPLRTGSRTPGIMTSSLAIQAHTEEIKNTSAQEPAIPTKHPAEDVSTEHGRRRGERITSRRHSFMHYVLVNNTSGGAASRNS
ncbi:hypothetical protein POSPLADRAFT_1030989 [Postia placenta MAD-698-R-SB12]|uniref:Uncharacterized protein n=1 Tax=Postia placenta MAD-698-R-SB12 TaxID=670580 RepID=A0A1X6NHV3_9APHY|nr:hypothetical protein POSPLADRAFT_1030989 [Postia placenta MAD-698-R-SB12]OSX68211.1 hypothetical protein POSPLADRAFT_1030989 [Postia placenta MAD-698-R-SB12]